MGCKSFKKLVRADDQALMNPNLSLLVTNAKTKCMLHLQHIHTPTVTVSNKASIFFRILSRNFKTPAGL